MRWGPAVVTRYPGTNAVIVAANPDAQRQLGEVIRQLDTRREQVLVEAIIVEIGDEAAKRLGVQFLLAGKNAPFAATNWSNAQPQIFTVGAGIANQALGRETDTTDSDTNETTTTREPVLGQAVTAAAVQSVLTATGGFAGGLWSVAKDTWFGTIINAVRSDTASNILSTPSIMTLDNQEAKLLVGQEVPITTGEALSSNFENQFRTVQRQNVGIQLDVKPQVNSSGSIKLYIRQEVSSVAGPVAPRSTDLILNKREFKTVLTVDTGDILAIGGLLDDNERKTIEKIPLLGDIPGIGELFKNRTRQHAKTNLMVFIRPTIVRTREEAQQVTAQRYGYIRNEQARRYPDKEPSIDSLVRDYMGTAPPMAAPMHQGDFVIRRRRLRRRSRRLSRIGRPSRRRSSSSRERLPAGCSRRRRRGSQLRPQFRPWLRRSPRRSNSEHSRMKARRMPHGVRCRRDSRCLPDQARCWSLTDRREEPRPASGRCRVGMACRTDLRAVEGV